jgi:imidazole glycerol-phosphate synthase subunit HisH
MSRSDVTVIDYGVGNLLSVRRGLEHCGAKVTVTGDAEIILQASRVVLPGVGAFGKAMQALERLGLVDTIHELAHRQTPFLGICLGMQLLLDESEEFGITKGLGLIPGRVVSVPNLTQSGQIQKIPNIGWNSLQPSLLSGDWHGTLLQDTNAGDAVYFVHSFMALPHNLDDRIADYVYGGHRIAAVVARNQISGCQFHPEKSGEVGLKILQHFLLL